MSFSVASPGCDRQGSKLVGAAAAPNELSLAKLWIVMVDMWFTMIDIWFTMV